MKGICWPLIGTRTEPLFSFSWLNYVALVALIAVELKPLMLLSKWWLILYVLWKTDCGQRARGYDVKTPLQMFPEQRAKSAPLFLCQNFPLFGLALACLWKWAALRCVSVCMENGGFLGAPIRNTCSLFQSSWMRPLLILPTNQPQVENTIVTHNLDGHTQNTTQIQESSSIFVSLSLFCKDFYKYVIIILQSIGNHEHKEN